ncbi:MAG TPA: hypothetical protein VE031_11240 [Chthoniobacterales bacterium]|nr:hypothetical protein [Chthoniobacterales bacterium]
MAELPVINEVERRVSPAPTPQALAWHNGELWFGSRDLGRIYRMDPKTWKVLDDVEAPGIPWASVSVGEVIWFTLGEGADDDRYLRRYVPGKGFADEPRIPCPDFTGSYLSHDGSNLYLSQWYNHRILKLDSEWNIVREIAIGAEISGHVFVDGLLYVLCGTEQNGGDWRLARLDPREEKPTIRELARVPFQCRSLTYDGQHLWTNYREADQIVCFAMPQ